MKWLYLDTGFNSGSFNMNLDEELAREAASGRSLPTLRFFQWKPFCISLGKNQTLTDIDMDRCLAQCVDVVRRPTGGRAILHAEELTYSVIFGGDGGGSIEDVHRQIGRALTAGLRKLGIPADMTATQADFRNVYQQASSMACFTSSARHEIQVAGKKLVGSAQRRFAGAVLQHGSILIGSNHRRLPEFLNLAEEDKQRLRETLDRKTIETDQIKTLEVESLKAALKEAFAEQFAIEFTEPEIEPHNAASSGTSLIPASAGKGTQK